MDIKTQKVELRQHLLFVRQRLLQLGGGVQYQRKSHEVGSQIQKFLNESEFGRVFTFFPHLGEPAIAKIFFDRRFKWFFPKVRGDSMDFYQCEGIDELKKGSFGIMEPLDSNVKVAQPTVNDVILVPGLAFDSRGHRLGYGKGFYDRYFKKLENLDSRSPSTLKIGIVFEEFVLEKVPASFQDVPVDIILTDTCIRNLNQY